LNYLKEVPKKAKNLSYRQIEENFYIVQPEKKKLHELNEVSSFIWKCIDGKKTWGEILNKVIENFEVNRETAKQDLKELREVLIKKELI